MPSHLPTLFVVPDFYQTELILLGGTQSPSLQNFTQGTLVSSLLNVGLSAVPFGNQLQTANVNAVKAWLDAFNIDTPVYWQRLTLGTNLQGMRILRGACILDNGFGYRPIAQALVQALSFSYGIMPWGYDWRQSLATAGQQLAFDLAGYGRKADQQAILALGYGALVVQWAMALLKQQGKDNLIDRILAVGPMFSGSYAAAQVWRLQRSALMFRDDQLFVPGNRASSDGARAAFVRGIPRIAARLTAFNSWPGVYDTLPDPGLSDDPRDLQRGQVWQASSWAQAPFPPDSAQLAAAQARQATLHSAAYAPDPTKWTVVPVVYSQAPTPWQLVPGWSGPPGTPPDAAWFYNLPGFTTTTQGDGRCTLASQNPYNLPSAIFEGVDWGVPTSRAFGSQLVGLLSAQPSAPSIHRVT